MISRVSLNERVQEWGLREDVVEKDYVVGWILWGIGSEAALRERWVFKGGTCLKKCYIETYRFSQDLDFTVVEDGPITSDDVLPVLDDLLGRVYEASGIDLAVQPPKLRSREGRRAAEGRIYYIGPRATPGPASVKLDLDGEERVCRAAEWRPIAHACDDELPDPGTVQCYSFTEVFAEKLRAMGVACRFPRSRRFRRQTRAGIWRASGRTCWAISSPNCRHWRSSGMSSRPCSPGSRGRPRRGYWLRWRPSGHQPPPGPRRPPCAHGVEPRSSFCVSLPRVG